MKHQPSYAPTYEIPLRQTRNKKHRQASTMTQVWMYSRLCLLTVNLKFH